MSDKSLLNTNEHRDSGNTKRSRKWTMTLNNYTDEDVSYLHSYLDTLKHYVYGKEVGESGTPHLQVYFEHNNAISFTTLKNKFPRAHFEIARGTKDENFKYCSKDGSFVSNYCVKLDTPTLVPKVFELLPWQCDIEEKVHNPSYRKIIWIYEFVGNVGKSWFLRYLHRKYNSLYFTGGKAADIVSQIILFEENNKIPGLFLFDLPRTNEGHVSYNALEQIKNGLVNCGKYKGGTVCFNIPTIIVCSNFEPDYEKLSLDRFDVCFLG